MDLDLLLLISSYPHNGLTIEVGDKIHVHSVHNKITKDVPVPRTVLSCQNPSDSVHNRGQGETPTFGCLCQTGLSLVNSPGAQICGKTVVNEERSSYGSERHSVQVSTWYYNIIGFVKQQVSQMPSHIPSLFSSPFAIEEVSSWM